MKPSTASPSTTKTTEPIVFAYGRSTDAKMAQPTIAEETPLPPAWVHQSVLPSRRRHRPFMRAVFGTCAMVAVLVGWPPEWFQRPQVAAEPIRVNLLDDEALPPPSPMNAPRRLPSFPREADDALIIRTSAQDKAEPKIAETPPVPPLKLDDIQLPKDLSLPITPMVSETPKVDAPKTDPPKMEPLKLDLPPLDAPKTDAPKVDAPKMDPLKLDLLPPLEAPKTDAPPPPEPLKLDPPSKVDAPKVDAPKMEPLVLPNEPPPLIPTPMPQPAQPAQPSPSIPPSQPAAPIPPDLNLSLPMPGNTVKPEPAPAPPMMVDPLSPPLKLDLDPPPPPMPAPVPMVKSPEVLPVPDEVVMDDEPYAIPFHLRDTPMTRHWKGYGLRTVLAAAMVTTMAAVSNAQTGDSPDKNPPMPMPMKPAPMAEDANVVEMRKQVEKVSALVNRLEKLEERLKDAASSQDIAIGGIQSEIGKIKNDLKQLRTEFDAFKKSSDNKQTTVLRPVDPAETNPKGKVLLKNDYLEEMLIIVNGLQYRLIPGQEMSVSVPAGSFTYQVPQLQSITQSRKLAADETYTIRVHPQSR